MKGKHYALRLLRRWHARFGVLAIVFFLLLAVSGIALNHGSELRLEGRKVHVAWLARWYGLKTEPPSGIYQTGNHILAWGNGLWLLDGKIIAEDISPPVGMIEASGIVYIATVDTLFAYTADHRLIEKIPASVLPAVPISAIGIKDKQVELRTGAEVFASADSLSWKRAPADKVAWSAAQPISPSLQHNLAALLVPGIPLSKLVSDIHSGRVFGKYGTLAVDALGLLLVILGLSGAWVFLRSRHRTEPSRASTHLEMKRRQQENT